MTLMTLLPPPAYPIQYWLGHRETSQLAHRKNKAYTLGLSQLLVFLVVAMNTDGFISYQCIRFIFSVIELRIFSVTKLVLYPLLTGSTHPSFLSATQVVVVG